jgi:hypothetical protein
MAKHDLGSGFYSVRPSPNPEGWAKYYAAIPGAHTWSLRRLRQDLDEMTGGLMPTIKLMRLAQAVYDELPRALRGRQQGDPQPKETT